MPSALPSTTEMGSEFVLVSFNGSSVCAIPSLPCGVALPGGLSSSNISADAAISLSPVAPENAVLIRLRTSLSVSHRDDTHSAVEALLESSLMFVDGIALAQDSAMHEAVGSRAEVSLFLSPKTGNPSNHRGVAFCLGEPRPRRQLDCVAYVRRDAQVGELRAALVDGAVQALRAVEEVDGAAFVDHFAILPNTVVLTVVMSKEHAADESAPNSIARRRELHRALGLPLNRVLMRRSRRIFASGGMKNSVWDGGCPGRLSNVHVGIKGHGLGGGSVTVHCVSDDYLYSHYMQDKFNDSGWGCAYRSLQTLLSWASMQGYVEFDDGVLPTHKDIQTALVAVGDKPTSLIGSRDWIGANEVCYAMEHLTGIASRILHVSRGSEMEIASRQLAAHFDDQGSPVMVGGGVLAWTILGVARDELTGSARFLILDPHYEGKDELDKIQAKGWVGWKSSDVFLKDAFYNLCLPIRPTMV